jgi:hypothetical protein
MGQYHILVNLDKKQFVSPMGIGLGSKQWEHLYGEPSLSDALYILTMVPESRGGGDLLNGCSDNSKLFFVGSWIGNRVAVVGDYTVNKDLPTYPEFGNIYNECQENLKLMYGYFPSNGLPTNVKKRNVTNTWQDITGDLMIELECIFNKKIIPFDHPTKWPDGSAKDIYRQGNKVN